MEPNQFDRQVRQLRIALVGVLLLASGSVAFSLRPTRQETGVVDARLLRIIDEQGRPRFLIGAPLPNPQVQGTVYERSRPVPGIMFLDTLGNETGGLGLFDDLDGGGLCFDHTTAEAVCLTKISRLGYIGLTVNDRPPPDARVGQTGSQRVQLAAQRGASSLVLSDSEGRARIRLAVDSLGVPRIEVLDEEGRPVFQAPSSR